VKVVFVLVQDAINLAGGDVDPQFQQLLAQQRLRDVAVVMLL